MATNSSLLAQLRYALRHLYSAADLQESPLIELLGTSQAADPASALRRTITEAIRALEPDKGVPIHSQTWRAYEILLYRYVQRCTQLEVADQLGISVRHLRREERTALELLLARLEHQFVARSEGEIPAEASAPGPRDQQELPSLSDEIAWLKQVLPHEPVSLYGELASAAALARPMALQHGVRLEMVEPQDGIMVAVHPVALRQILLSMLSAAIRWTSGTRVLASLRALGDVAEVQIRTFEPRDQDRKPEDVASLGTARALASACGGLLTTDSGQGCFVATLTLSTYAGIGVLLIDDNVDTLRLFERYAVGSPFRIIPATSLDEALAAVRESALQVIVLDVMMPAVDGWDLLGQLKHHPLTSHLPILVCTILAQEELALSLGASGFAQKPLTREAFLSALARQAYRAAPGAR